MDAHSASLPPPLPPSALADEIGRAPGAVWPLAPRSRRIAASFVDSLCLLLVLAPGGLFVLTVYDHAALRALGIGVVLLSGLAFALYQGWLLTTEGQTVAKRWLQLRIVRVEDQENPGFVRAVVVRTLLSNGLGGFLGGLYPILDLFVMLLREDRRAVHDLLAGTEVIDERDPH